MTLQDIKARYKQIPGFEDYYITDCGEVYSKRRRVFDKEPQLRKLKPKNPGRDDKYLNVILCNDNGQFTKSVHRLVAENFVDGYFVGAVVNHIDGDNRNNAASNLEWTTVRENVYKSYITSGKSARRNTKEWRLYDPNGRLLGIFADHLKMEKYVILTKIDASPSQLTKKGNSRGYYVIKS